ncbi:MAG: hypothetical protein RR585_06285 [Coprobacillus sp.]
MKNNCRKEYMKNLKHNLVYIGKTEKKALDVINYEIEQYMEEGTTYNDLVMRFGDPQILADGFIEGYDKITLREKIKLKKILLVVCITVIFVIGSVLILGVVDRFNAKNVNITSEVEVISEY